VYFNYLCWICSLNCIFRYILTCICILNSAHFKIVSQNTLQKVNLMRSLMADWYRWLYSSGWWNNSRSFFHPGAARCIFLTLYFRLTEQYPLPKSVLCSNILCTSCDIVTLRCTGLVVVVHDCMYCILYFVVKIQKIQHAFWKKYFKYTNHKVF